MKTKQDFERYVRNMESMDEIDSLILVPLINYLDEATDGRDDIQLVLEKLKAARTAIANRSGN